MSQTTNQQIFNNISSNAFFKSQKEASNIFKKIQLFENAIGYDLDTEGFIVLHKGHQPAAIVAELPALLVIKRYGHAIEMLDESYSSGKEPDVRIDGLKYFDIRRIAHATRLAKRVDRDFQGVIQKGCKRIILHIDQSVNKSMVINALKDATKRRKGIIEVWLIFQNQLHYLDREVILKGNFIK